MQSPFYCTVTTRGPIHREGIMHKVDRLHHASSHQFITYINTLKTVQAPFTDQDLIELQEKFLTNGFQYLKTPSIDEGRSIIEMFLSTISIHHTIAYFSLETHKVGYATNIYSILKEGYLNSYDGDLEEYFIEHFYFDFMWIEGTKDVLQAPWFETFKNAITCTGIDNHIPILVCVY